MSPKKKFGLSAVEITTINLKNMDKNVHWFHLPCRYSHIYVKELFAKQNKES